MAEVPSSQPAFSWEFVGGDNARDKGPKAGNESARTIKSDSQPLAARTGNSWLRVSTAGSEVFMVED